MTAFCCSECGRVAVGDQHVCLEVTRADAEWRAAVTERITADIAEVTAPVPLEAEPVRPIRPSKAILTQWLQENRELRAQLEAANDEIERLQTDLETCRVQRDAASSVAEIAAQLAADAGSWEDLDKAVDLYRAVTL